MSNIYLRVPTYLAQFLRGRYQQPLTEQEPIVFSQFDPDQWVLEQGLMLRDGEPDVSCLSQREWRNVTQGKSPQGGRRILQRDEQAWPTMQEVAALTGEKINKKTEGFDYVTIQMPRTVVIGLREVPTNASFTLPRRQAAELVGRLRREFIRKLVGWVREERYYCDQKGIRRDLTMIIDHFFYHHNMLLGTNTRDRDSMRRMAARWIEDAMAMPPELDDEDALFVYERERGAQDKSLSDLLKELNAGVKKS